MRWLPIALALGTAAAPKAYADESTHATDAAVEKPDVEAATQAATVERRAQIARALAEVRDEEASTTRFWPILTIAVATTAVLAAATAGAIEAIDCDGSCRAGAWQGPTVVGGAAVATFGIIWLRWTDADLRELASRRDRLEVEREQLEPSAPVDERASAEPRVTLAVRASF